MVHASVLIAAAFALTSLSGTPIAGAQCPGSRMFEDTTFMSTDWAASTVSLVPGASAQECGPPSGDFRSIHEPTIGRPAPCRLLTYDIRGGGSLRGADMNSTAVHDPTVHGPIQSISVRLDAAHQVAPWLSTSRVHVVIRQGGAWYFRSLGFVDPVEGTWRTLSADALQPTDFNLGGGTGPATPDFQAGPQLQFGIGVEGSSRGTTGCQSSAAVLVDNWSLCVSASVPIPVEASTWSNVKGIPSSRSDD